MGLCVDLGMKKLYPLLSVLFLIYWGCDDPKEEDTEKPTVSISYPLNNSTVSEMVTINCISSDNEGVEKVELWVNGVSTDISDNTEPYSFDWNTTLVDNGSYSINVRSFDTSDNTTDSEPITLMVDNSGSYPQPVSITSIDYTLTEMTIIWSQSTESDFDHYELLVSENVDGNKSLLEEVNEQDNNTYVLTEFDPTQSRWYWITVVDVYGYSTISSGYNVLDDNPTPVELYPISYDNNSFIITWSMNNDYDFYYYKLYQSFSEDMSNQVLVYETNDIGDTTYVVTDIDDGELRFYQVVIIDIFGLQAGSMILWGFSSSNPCSIYNPSSITNVIPAAGCYQYGYKFTQLVEKTVCQIDYMYSFGTGRIGYARIYTTDNQTLISSTPITTTSTGEWSSVSVIPVTLNANTNYTIVIDLNNSNEGGDWSNGNDDNVVYDSDLISYISGVYEELSHDIYPSLTWNGYWGAVKMVY